ncbi:MAG: hypothetical protein JWR80_6705 [Bradyrhizobium sp.]|nr:hypothetical protein [Bradyrhizobium sp.]
MVNLDELQSLVEGSIAAGALRLTAGLHTAIGFPDLPAWFVPDADLTLAAARLERLPERLILAGSLDHPLLGALALQADITIVGGAPRASVRAMLPEPRQLTALLQALGIGWVSGAAQFLDALVAHATGFERMANGLTQARIEVHGALSIALGGSNLTLQLDAVALAADPTLDALSGRLLLGALDLPLGIALDGPIRVSARAPDVTLEQLVRALGLQLPALPPVPLLTVPLDDFQIELDPAPSLSGRLALSDIGSLGFTVALVEGEVALVAGVDVRTGFRFSDLSPALAPLDALMSLVSFGAPAIILSSVDGEVPFLPSDGSATRLLVEKGLAFRGLLDLTAPGIEILATLVGLETLPFTLPLTPDLSGLRLVARLPAPVAPLPGVLSIADLAVSATIEPFSLSAAGTAHLELFGAQLPALRIGAAFGGAQEAVFLKTAEPWHHPAGLPIDVQEVGVQLSSPPPSYGFFGKVSLGARTLDVAAQFFGEVPSALIATLDGDLPLGDLLLDMVGINLMPDFLEPVLKSPAIYIVLNPLGILIAERTYPAGLGVSGRATYLGFELALSLSARPDRVTAEAMLVRPVSMAPVLKITGANGQGTPRFAIDTAGDPVATFNGRISMLGFNEDISATVAASGITFRLDQNVGPVHVQLASELGHGRFTAQGSCDFGIKGSIGPIRPFEGGPSLGKFNLDAAFVGHIIITVIEQGDASLAVSGSFVFLGLTIRLPEVSLAPDSLVTIPEAILRYIAEHATALFAELLANADLWLKAVADLIITEVENVARALKEYFTRTTNEIAKGLTDIAHYTAEQTAKALQSIGEPADKVFDALRAAGIPDDDAGKALLLAGYPPVVVTTLLKALGKSVELVGDILRSANVPVQIVTDVIGQVFGGLGGSGSGFPIPIPVPPIFLKAPVFLKAPIHLKHLKIF